LHRQPFHNQLLYEELNQKNVIKKFNIIQPLFLSSFTKSKKYLKNIEKS